MAVKLTSDLRPGQLYINEQGGVFRLSSYCTLPTATVEEVTTGWQSGGGFGCLNLEPFKAVGECSREELEAALDGLASAAQTMAQELAQLREKNVGLKLKVKFPEEFDDEG